MNEIVTQLVTVALCTFYICYHILILICSGSEFFSNHRIEVSFTHVSVPRAKPRYQPSKDLERERERVKS